MRIIDTNSHLPLIFLSLYQPTKVLLLIFHLPLIIAITSSFQTLHSEDLLFLLLAVHQFPVFSFYLQYSHVSGGALIAHSVSVSYKK
jgi:hypothetical protein